MALRNAFLKISSTFVEARIGFRGVLEYLSETAAVPKGEKGTGEPYVTVRKRRGEARHGGTLHCLVLVMWSHAIAHGSKQLGLVKAEFLDISLASTARATARHGQQQGQQRAT
jgi:hypothetical protein